MKTINNHTLIVSDVLSGFHPPADDCFDTTKYGSDLLNRSLFASLNPLSSRVRLRIIVILCGFCDFELRELRD